MKAYKEQIRENLEQLAEDGYRKFSAALLPGVENVLGVRLPKLRKLAQKIAADDWQGYLADPDGTYMESLMLQGMVMGYAKAEWEIVRPYIENFVPKINSWSVCDCCCSSFKVLKKNQEAGWIWLQKYLLSDKEFEIRFGLVALLWFFIEEKYLGQIFEILDKSEPAGYYVKMAKAWLAAECFIKFPVQTTVYLEKSGLDDWSFNKTLQKICESFRVSPEVKERIRKMRRK